MRDTARCAWADVKSSVVLVHLTCSPTQPGDIDGVVETQTYEVLKVETKDELPMFRWAYLSYSMFRIVRTVPWLRTLQRYEVECQYSTSMMRSGRRMRSTPSKGWIQKR